MILGCAPGAALGCEVGAKLGCELGSTPGPLRLALLDDSSDSRHGKQNGPGEEPLGLRSGSSCVSQPAAPTNISVVGRLGDASPARKQRFCLIPLSRNISLTSSARDHVKLEMSPWKAAAPCSISGKYLTRRMGLASRYTDANMRVAMLLQGRNNKIMN